MNKINLVGKRFGRLLVIADAGYHVKAGGQRTSKWLCQCDCGKETFVVGYKIRNGLTKSCGCIKKEKMSAGLNRSHGMTNSPEYETWCSMIKRCQNENDSNYHRYGGRGISVCKEWLSFDNFLSDMGSRPTNTSIDRIDVNGNYEPSNCRWSTQKEQGNNRRNNRLINFNGQEKTLSEWACQTGIGVRTLWYRLNSGWSIDIALTAPVNRSKSHHRGA